MAVRCPSPYTWRALPARDQGASIGWWAGGRSHSGIADVLPIFTVVDATQSTDGVVGEVVWMIRRFREQRAGAAGLSGGSTGAPG
jgi:hypothetical protein